jgi:hypothetical protein
VALLAVVAVITGQVLLELPAWGMLAVTVAELLPEVVVVGFPLPAQLPQLLQLVARAATVLQSRFREFPLFTAVAAVAAVALLAARLELVVLAQVGAETEVPTQRQTRAVAAAAAGLLAGQTEAAEQAVLAWLSSVTPLALHPLWLPLLLRLVEPSQTQLLAVQTTRCTRF